MADDNVSLLRAALETVWNQGNAESVDRYYHDDFVGHYPEPWGVRGAQALRMDVEALITAFPDFHEEIHDLIAADDKVIARYTISGTQAADFNGQPATGKQFSVASIDIYRFFDGKVAEHWTGMDFLTMYKQLGWHI